MGTPVALWVLAAAWLTALFVRDIRQSRTTPTARQAAAGVAQLAVHAALFCGAVLVLAGGDRAGEFAAGWLTEYSLSADNLFVFLALMGTFAVPQQARARVLTVGIVLALILRAALIAVGAQAIASGAWVFYLFGGFLAWTAWNVARGGGDQAAEVGPPWLARVVTRVLPSTPEWHGPQLTARKGGRRLFTPMLAVIAAIGTADVLFALDSIPAIFGLTRDPFIVVTANGFALLGLRHLFFLLDTLLERLVLLSQGLAVLLGFIAVKLVAEAARENSVPFVNGGRPIGWVPEIGAGLSLGVIVLVLGVTVAGSLLVERRRAVAPVPAGS